MNSLEDEGEEVLIESNSPKNQGYTKVFESYLHQFHVIIVLIQGT